MTAGHRTFVAIALPEGIRDDLAALQRGLAIGRPVPPENLHLTLAFLGDQTDEALEEAHLALSGLRAAAFDVQLAGVDVLGEQAPRLVFAGVAPNPALAQLERAAVQALRAAGLRFARQRFRPHVTIARLSGAPGWSEIGALRHYLAGHAGFRPPPFRVDGFGLWRSHLSRKGARYEELARYALSAG